MYRNRFFAPFIMVVLIILTPDLHCFSFKTLWSKRRAIVTRYACSICKSLVGYYWDSYLETHGYDIGSRLEESRRFDVCDIPFPAYIQDDVPIAEGVVPGAILSRIASLKRKSYYNVCRPILLTGCAGSGKTQLARYMAKQAQCPFMNISAAGLLSGTGNSGAKSVVDLFKRSRVRSELAVWALRAKKLLFWFLRKRPLPEKEPAVILIDEFDAIGKSSGDVSSVLETARRDTLMRLIWEMYNNPYMPTRAIFCPPVSAEEHGFLFAAAAAKLPRDEMFRVLAYSKKTLKFVWRYFFGEKEAETLVVATTNCSADELDVSVRENFEIIEMKPLNKEQRQVVLAFHARNKPVQDKEKVIQDLAQRTEGWSAAALASIFNRAGLLMACKNEDSITPADIEQILQAA